MVGDVVHEVPGELVGLLDQAAEVIARDAVEDPPPVATDVDQTHQA